ncbi:MAG TPA: transglycosylase SLT domain-containing protein [Myxococcota bacterium]|nr:transglycosylase SLT domain-containing protein [Myxococcota bacterium]
MRFFIIAMAALLCAMPACDQKPDHSRQQTSTARDTAPEPQSSEPQLVYYPAAGEEPAPTADLEQVRTSGVLRFLYVREPGAQLPRQGGELVESLRRASALAESLGLEARFVRVDHPAELFTALRQGRGEIVGTFKRPADDVTGVTFTAPLVHVKQVLVMRRGDGSAPRRLDLLPRHKIFMADAPGTTATVSRIEKILGQKLDLVRLSGDLDTGDILDGVGSGRYQLTIARSDQVAEYLAYRDDVEEGFVLEDRVPLAWAVKSSAPELLDAVNGFLYQYALTTHLRRQFGGDLPEIHQHKVLRVAMLNNSVAYYIYRGQEVGFQFELAELLSRRLAVRLEIVIPEHPKDVTRLLVENRADVAVVSPSKADPYLGQISYSMPFHSSDQVLVQPKGEGPIKELVQLMYRNVHVRRSSQYFRKLQIVALVVPGLRIVESPEDLGTEDLIDRVGRKQIPLTVANSVLLGSELNFRNDVQGTLVLARNMPLVFAVRRESPGLLGRLNVFIRQDCRGAFFNGLIGRYFTGRKRISEVRREALDTTGVISPYDDLARKYGREYAIDWRLILAQMYKESRFDPRATSWSGARGLLQVMPQTAREMGFTNLWDPDTNIHAGVTYLAWLITKFEPSVPMRQRIRFALASYNAGLGHVRDARRLAWRLSYDADKWFDNVERAMLLLQKPDYHRQARYGYCRGSEPVQYVSEIQTKYDAYSRLMPAAGPRPREGE